MDTDDFRAHNTSANIHTVEIARTEAPSSLLLGRPLIGASCNYCLRQALQKSPYSGDTLSPPIKSSTLNISPLGIELAITPAASECSLRQQIDLLEQEIVVRAINISRRPVHLLTLKDPSGSLSASDITELVFTLGKHFNLNHNGQRVYTLNSHPKSLDSNYLALLKGVGFNRIELNTDHLIATTPSGQIEHFRALRKTLKQLPDYNFPLPSWDFHYGTVKPQQALEQLDYLLSLNPSRIQLREITSVEHNATLFTELFNSLLSQGYVCIGNDCFVEPEHPIAKAKVSHQLCTTFGGYNSCHVKDWVGLGPGLYSQIDNVYYRNHTDQHLRSQFLMNFQLPIANLLTLTPLQQRQYIASNTLNAYHQLNLASAQHCINTDTQWLCALQQKYGATKDTSQQLLNIKASDILQLREIQASLISAPPNINLFP